MYRGDFDKDGGPAFPSPTANDDQHGQLSVRDYFAAQAMTAIGRTYTGTSQDSGIHDMLGKPSFKEEAHRCYEWADAMLAERAK
jgi:hypothetical protein